MSKLPKALVLGANGFIGSHLVDQLALKQFDVVAFDHFSKTPRFKGRPGVERFNGDILNLDNVAAALEGVTYVMHCFSATTPYSSERDIYLDIDNNLVGSVKLFELCAQHGVAKIVYISSGGAIYGASAENGRSAKETDAALPISPYAINKLATERYLDYFAKKYGLHHVSYRLSNPYGPRQVTKHNQGVVPRFIESILGGTPLMLYGDGSSSRDYIYIEDAAEMIAGSFANCRESVYNIGSGIQTSLSSLVKTLEGLLRKKAIIKKLPEPVSFVHSTQLDVSRFTHEFNLSPKVDLEQGLRKTIAALETGSTA